MTVASLKGAMLPSICGDGLVSSGHTLVRITTEYIDIEDRIRLTGEVSNASPIIIWLSQRMLMRLLPTLVKWLEGLDGDTRHAQVMHGFVQQLAQSELAPQAPVQAQGNSHSWLVHSVDISHTTSAMTMTFRGGTTDAANLTMESKPLRQWLGILSHAAIKAQWNSLDWPDWLDQRSVEVAQQGNLLH